MLKISNALLGLNIDLFNIVRNFVLIAKMLKSKQMSNSFRVANKLFERNSCLRSQNSQECVRTDQQKL